MKTHSLHIIGTVTACIVLLCACSQANQAEPTVIGTSTQLPAFTPIPSPTARLRGSLPTLVQPIATVTLTTASEPTPAVQVDVNVYDEDKFTDSEHYWLGVYSTSRISIKDGNLVLNSNPGSHIAGAYCEDCGPYKGDYFFEADIAIQKESDAGYGLIFGYVNPDDYWTVIISPGTDSYAVYRMVDGEWKTRIEMTSTGDLYPFPEVNKIGVSFNSNTIDVYINGQRQVDSIVNQSYPPGKVGFYSNYGYILLTATDMVVYKEIPYP